MPSDDTPKPPRRDSMLPMRASSMLPPRSSNPPRSTIPPQSPVPPASSFPTRNSFPPRRTLLPRSSQPPDLGDSLPAGSSSYPASAAERSLERMTQATGELGRLVGATLGLPGRQDDSGNTVVTRAPGAPAGIEHLADGLEPPAAGSVRLRVIDVCRECVDTHWFEDVDTLLAAPKPEWVQLRWVDVDGLDPYVVSQLQRAFGFHTLAAEDVLHVPQRPRVDAYTDHLFIVARMFSWRDERLVSEQISLFMRPGLLVSFQELDEDVWNPIRDRMQYESSKLRECDASYLAYALLDATVDHCFPILERYGEMLDHLEDSVLMSNADNLLQEVHAIKREMTVLRKAVWPMREVIAELSREDQPLVSPTTRTYLRDVYQHCVQVIDIIETFRELAASLTDLSLSMAGNRMNEVMKALAIVSTVFIPITFVAGVYGMNFDFLPELHWKYSYVLFWMFCIAVGVGQVWYFRRRGWWGGGRR
jgi:magnesium transporter